MMKPNTRFPNQRFSVLSLLAALLIGCTTTKHSVVENHRALNAIESATYWREIDGLHNAYAPADFPVYKKYDYENGGWVDVHDTAFFIPHGLSKEENDALIESLLGPVSTWEYVSDASLKIGQILITVPLSVGYAGI